MKLLSISFFRLRMGCSSVSCCVFWDTGMAEEVLSELYEEVRRRAAQFGKQNERPLTWLILMTHRRAIERLCNHLNTNREKLRTGGGKTKTIFSVHITEQRRLLHAAV